MSGCPDCDHAESPTPVTATPASSTEVLIHAAALDRLLMLLLLPPDPHRPAALRELAPALEPELRDFAIAAADQGAGALQAEYHVLLGFSGLVPTCESDLGDGVMRKASSIPDVAGFYRAFSWAPAELRDSPDHIASELGFASWLALKQAAAQDAGNADATAVTAEARDAFEREHLGPFGARLAERLLAVAPDGSLFAHVAALLALRCQLPDMTGEGQDGRGEGGSSTGATS